MDMTEKEVLVENVLNEIKSKTASAASDRRTHEVIEKLCYASDLPHLIEILSRFSPYSAFLTENRYSAHIIQVLLITTIHLFSSL